MVGGWTEHKVEDKDNDIDSFIKKEIPELADATLVKVRTQVVSGTNYEYTYAKDNKKWRITVWDQPWLKHREMTGVARIVSSVNKNGDTVQTTTSVEKETFAQAVSELF